MADFKPIETQEEFDAMIKKRIAQAEAKVAEQYKGYVSPDDLQNLKASHADEIAKLKASHAEALKKYEGYDEKFATQTARIHDLEVGAMKTKVALGRGLSLDAVEFLQGEDEKSISESADKLSKLSAPFSVGFTRNTESGSGSSVDAELRKLASQFSRN